MPEEAIQRLFEKLIELGEDREELAFYKDIFDDLSPEAQQALQKNLEEEILALTPAL